MAKETRPKGYPKLKNYKPSRFMLPTSHYDKAKADRAVKFIENLCHTKGKWLGSVDFLEQKAGIAGVRKEPGQEHRRPSDAAGFPLERA